jgi:glycosyltransferase involved in cell wall biosynthesis
LFQLVDGFFSYGIKSNTYLFKHHVPRKKIYSFLNTFDKSKFTIHQKPRINEGKYLLYVGRLSNEKNLTALINLFDRIKGEISEYHLIIIGNGPDRQTLQEKIKSLDLTTQIKLLGSINWEDLSIYFKHAECLILPSKFEPWGMVANEAQEMGLPVICSSACGCSNDLIIDNYTGIIFEEIITQKNDEKIVNFLQISNNLSIRNFILKNSNIFNLDRLSMEILRKI